MVQEDKQESEAELRQKKLDRLKAGLFFTVVTSLGVFSGFSLSLSATKERESKEELENFKRGKIDRSKNTYYLHASGAALARKALFRATVYSVSGFSLFCLGIWKLSGASNFQEFRQKIGNILPRLKRNNVGNEGRTEFKNLTELFQYIIDEDNKAKGIKPSENDK